MIGTSSPVVDVGPFWLILPKPTAVAEENVDSLLATSESLARFA